VKDKIKSVLPIAGLVSLLVTVGIISIIQHPDDYQTKGAGSTSSVDSVEADAGTYEDIHGTSECTDDCSGHEAGYQWAEENDICDPEYDNGNSDSFNEGVVAWAYDNCYYKDEDGPL